MKALVVVDLQNDFMPGGSLAVAQGDQVVPVANTLMRRSELVVATQDWHPADHASFAVNHPGALPGEVIDLEGIRQVLWPAHCVQDTRGAEFHDGLDQSSIDHVVRKGTDPRIDSYSAFFDNGHRKETELARYLRERGVDALTLLGLATDYCVKFTALDALELGFRVEVAAQGCRAVDLAEGDGAAAFEEMRRAGCGIIETL